VSPEELTREAREALRHAHAPYSNFPVGAALLAESGKLYRGANVENASHGLAVCAERSAVFAAVSDGQKHFRAIAIATDTDEPTPPCGACRQVLREFATDLPVYLVGRGPEIEVTSLSKLLPRAFGPSHPGEASADSD
jgi:cytidine deaminase